MGPTYTNNSVFADSATNEYGFSSSDNRVTYHILYVSSLSQVRGGSKGIHAESHTIYYTCRH